MIKKIILTGAVLLFVIFLIQACNSDVGGDEDHTEPIVVLISPTGGEEVIGTYKITWETDEPNRSTVEIFVSHDSGRTWQEIQQDNIPETGIPDTGTFEWDSNGVDDCRTCRIKIIAIDIAGNWSEPTESSNDFTINNIPQLLGTAFYYDSNNDGYGGIPGDRIILPFDKDINIFGSFATAFKLPVIGDSIGADATMTAGPESNQVTLTFTAIPPTTHLHINGEYNSTRIHKTAPSGIDVLGDIPVGIITAIDTGKTAAPSGGIDIAPTFSEDNQEFIDSNHTISIVFGDVDNDGDLDFITGNYGEPNRVYLNNINNTHDKRGEFTVTDQLLGNSHTNSLVLGDVNGDKYLDLIEGNGAVAGIINEPNRVWLNNGNGYFTVTVQLLGNSQTYSVALGDVNGDKNLDLIEGTGEKRDPESELGYVNEPERVWLNNGNGYFTVTEQLLGNNVTTSIAIGDVDNDGDLDLVTGNRLGRVVPKPGESNANRVWLNNGDGVFSDSEQLLGNSSTKSVAIHDLDSDGDLDLVAGNGSLDANRVWLNNGSGIFTDSEQLLGFNTYSVVLGDVDDDSDIDLVTGNHDGPNKIWLNNGSGEFTDSGQLLGNSDTESIVLGDVDGDGDIDLVSGNGDQPNRLWLNSDRYPYNAIFIDSLQLLGDSDTRSVALGDVDKDGDLDLVSGNGGFQPNRIWLNNINDMIEEQGVYTDSGIIPANRDTITVLLGDVDGDGDLDWVEANGIKYDAELGNINDSNRVLLNSGNGVFTESQELGNDDSASIVLGDVDGDNDLDIVTGNYGPNRVWINDGTGYFTVTDQEMGYSDTISIVLGDIDGDQNLDIITGNYGLNRVWKNEGTGYFTLTDQTLGSNTYSIALGDVDGDRNLDIVTGNYGPNRVWKNDGTGYFTVTEQTLGDNNTSSIALDDVDGDNDLDIIAGNKQDTNLIWLNDGSGVFREAQEDLGSGTTESIALGDVDQDGDIDISFGNADFQPNEIWLNDH